MNPEIVLIIAVVILLVVGGKKIPELLYGVTKGMKDMNDLFGPRGPRPRY